MAKDSFLPALTIAVPYYRGVDYFRRALKSIFGQPSSCWSALIVDNSREEEDHDLVKTALAGYPKDRVRYVRNQAHLGSGESLNRCIDLAKTDLVSIVHADDEVLPCYAEELVGLADRHPDAAILFVAVRIIDARSRPLFSFVDWFKRFLMPRGDGDFILSDEHSLCSVLRGNWINGGALCYRKSRLGDLRFNADYQMTGDLDLFSRVILAGKSIVGTRQPAAYLYRRHVSQTTSELSASLYRFREEALMLDIIGRRAADRGWRSASDVARKKTIVQLHLLYLMLADILRLKFAVARRKLRALREVRESARSGANARR